MAEGGTTPASSRYTVEKAWENLVFQIKDKKTLYEKDVTESIEPCKLQFVLHSAIALPEFNRRLKENIVFVVLSPGHVVLETDLQKLVFEGTCINSFWSYIISSVVKALQSRVVKEIRFTSKEQLDLAVQDLDEDMKHLVHKGLVGVYFTHDGNFCVVKLVGIESDVDSLCDKMQPANTNPAVVDSHLETSGFYKDIEQIPTRELQEEKFELISISMDEFNYLEAVKFEDHFKKEYPNVKLLQKDEDDNSISYKVTSLDKKALEHALSWIESYRKNIKRREVELPLDDIQFLNCKNVRVHLLRKLKNVPAYADITANSITVWCKDADKLEDAAKVIYSSFEVIEFEGFISSEAQRILENSHGKIQLFQKQGSNEAHVIRYTKDKKNDADELMKEMASKMYREVQISDQWKFKAMLSLSILSDLRRDFPDVNIQVDEEKSIVIIQGSDRVRDVLEDLKVILQRIRFVPIDFLSDSAQKLLSNETVRKYVHDQVKQNGITVAVLLDNRKCLQIVCMGKDYPGVKEHVENCFVEMNIDRDCLEGAEGQDFFETHHGEIVRKDFRRTSFLCFTLNLKQDVENLLPFYRKEIGSVVRDFLQTFGRDLLKDIADRHNVEAEIKQGYLYFKGKYHEGKAAMEEVESSVEIAVLHFDVGKIGASLLSKQKKERLSAISKQYKCSWKAINFPHNQPDDLDKVNDGIEYLATWKLNGVCQISVAEVVDFKKAKLDLLIVPVNECMIGEDIFNSESVDISYSSSQKEKVKCGWWKPANHSRVDVSTSIVRLVTSYIVIVDNIQQIKSISAHQLQEAVAEIVYDSFSRGQYKIGFAVPGDEHNFRGKTISILSGFEDMLKVKELVEEFTEPELLLSVKGSAQWWIQEVDSCLKGTECTKRQVFPRYYGMFDKPNVTTEIVTKSLLDVGADCYVAAISPDLNLSKGFLSKLISKACGRELQEKLYRDRRHKNLADGDLIVVDSFNLSKQGVKKLMFGVLPAWKDCQKTLPILERLVQESLLLAESCGCKTVAFPTLGTGNLMYPVLDAAVAILDGIEKYRTETTVGHISTVYITTPNSIEVDIMSKVLEKEKARKKVHDSLAEKQSQMQDDHYLFAEGESVKYYIMTEKTYRVWSSSRHVDVLFKPVDRKSSEVIVTISLEGILVECKDDAKGIKDAVAKLVKECEKERITSTGIFCSQGFKVSEGNQIDDIILAVQETVHTLPVNEYPVRRQFKYLKHVTMVTSDVAFSSISNLRLIQGAQPKTEMGLLQSMKQSLFWKNAETPLRWTLKVCRMPQVFTNVVLVGGVDSNIKKAKEDIIHLNTTKLDNKDESAEFGDAVSAELNQGIVKYLKTLPEADFVVWKQHLAEAFGVKVTENENNNKIIISGLFENILKIEHYLENGFPALPNVDDSYSEDQKQTHKEDQLTCFKVSVDKHDKQSIMYFFHEELQAISNDDNIASLRTDEDAIWGQCKAAAKDFVESEMNQLIRKAKQLYKKAIPLSQEELSFVINMKLPEGVFCQPDKKRVVIISRQLTLVQNAERQITEALQKTHISKEVKFRFQLVAFRFKNLKVSVCCKDITEVEYDCIVSPVNEMLNHGFGVARVIAGKAGNQYLQELKSVESEKPLEITHCVDTGAGDLKCKRVIHVHSPVKFTVKHQQEQLLEIYTSLRHCLERAEQLQLKSVAIPFLGTGVSGFPVALCAQQYFKALTDFQQGQHLEEAHFVDISQEKVSDICHMMSKCLDPTSDDVRQTYAELTLVGHESSIKIYITNGKVYSVHCDSFVVNIDENLHGIGQDLDKVLTLGGQQFEHTYREQAVKNNNKPASVLSIKSSGELLSKTVLFAVTPNWETDQDNYRKQIGLTTQNILEKMCASDLTTLAMSVLCDEDAESDVLLCCCNAMVESVLKFSGDKRNRIKEIHFLTTKEAVLSILCHAMALGLKQ